MTVQTSQPVQTTPVPTDQKAQDKEYNFRIIEKRAQEAERRAQDAERRAQDAERKAQELSQIKAALHEEDDDSDEPYVAPKSLKKQLNKFSQNNQLDIQKAMEQAKHTAKLELKQEMWFESNPDFEKVMTNENIEKFYQENKELASSILSLPQSFEREKLVYNTVKKLVVQKPVEKQSTTQDKIDANRRSGAYMPSGSGNSPYVTGGDYSQQGQKAAYDKIQALKKTMRI